MTSYIVFVLWIIWTVVLLILYHKIFKVYYFSLSRGLFQEVFIAALIGLMMAGLTLYFWWLPAIIIIIWGFIMTQKTSNNAPLIGCILLAMVIAMSGNRFTKEMKKNQTKESSNIEDLEDLKDFYDKYNDLAENTYSQNEDEMEDNTSDSLDYTENQPFDDEEILEYYNSEYILPNSDSEYLTMKDLKGFSANDCRLARNELYARYGRKFDSKDLQKHFNSCSWYQGIIEPDDFQESMLNDVEIANRDLIIKYEEKMGYR